MQLKAVQAFNTPKDACAITQVRALIFDVRHIDSKSQLNTPESQLTNNRHYHSQIQRLKKFTDLRFEVNTEIKTGKGNRQKKATDTPGRNPCCPPRHNQQVEVGH